MSIILNDNVFVLETKNHQYVIGVNDDLIQNLHWGKKASPNDFSLINEYERNSNHSALDYARTEYVPFGGTMYRDCALKATFDDGCRDIALKYESYTIEGNNLYIILKDKSYDFKVTLQYTVYEEYDLIERRTILTNTGSSDIILEKFMSAEINLPSYAPYEILNTNGSWGGEFLTSKQKLESGMISFESRKGTTSHHHIPALIASQNATYECGEVYFAVLKSSGNFKVAATRDYTGKTRAILGYNDFDYSHTLLPNEELSSPSVICGIADGYDDMSNRLSKFTVSNILPKRFANEDLPVLYNSWEATGFDVSEEGQLKLAKTASEIGCELFVMDDGWFGQRKNDWAGLGDWYVNKEKFPNGLKPLVDGVNELGMDFGIWFEPEMVNPDSDLYRNHPDWAYNYPTREHNELRHQLVLNMTKPEVKEYIFNSIDSILSECNIKYIKWDMNRPFSEIGASNLDNPKELWQRHTEAVFEIVDKLKAKYSDLQIESCSSGGGRVDLETLSHYDMVWTSDNTDPIDRLDIQNGFSYIYPIKCMRAWVTDANKDQRPVALDYRFASSMLGSLSIGSNLLECSEDELQEYKKHIALYKKYRHTIQFGTLHRIYDQYNDRIYLTGYVSEDKSEAIYFAFSKATCHFGTKHNKLYFKGLDPNATYFVKSKWREYKNTGAFFENVGVEVSYDRPLESEIFEITKA